MGHQSLLFFSGWVGFAGGTANYPSQAELNGAPVMLFLSGVLGFAVGTANYPTQAELAWGTSPSLLLGWVGFSLVVQRTTPLKRSLHGAPSFSSSRVVWFAGGTANYPTQAELEWGTVLRTR